MVFSVFSLSYFHLFGYLCVHPYLHPFVHRGSVLSTLLMDLERKGELDLIKNRLKEQNHDEQKDDDKDEHGNNQTNENKTKKKRINH